jgi:hypothetical protein
MIECINSILRVRDDICNEQPKQVKLPSEQAFVIKKSSKKGVNETFLRLRYELSGMNAKVLVMIWSGED